ncbi:hypothetical protein M514_05889 [Trichuris suis]|uniref:Uncharacterized protein n=1 Tax=Trichuris suis TaxID=68888 RepID=A0A085MU21_9BILA|nr:hypothetical protein M513_05889 [Trichuris suis]KFD60717.1 hypothetical protein M514_05889 [Trichuris suis]
MASSMIRNALSWVAIVSMLHDDIAFSLPFGQRLQPVYEYREYIPPSRWPTEITVAGSYPFMHRPSDDMIKPEPFMSEFVNGFATGSERIKFMKGSLNIPSVRHNAIWDLTGQLRLGPSLTHFNWQNDVLRKNSLKLSPAAQNVLEHDPAFEQEFGSLGRSAYSSGCTSVYCKNPGSGFDGAMVMQPPKNFYLNGKLDFPLFTGTYGDGYRFDRHFDIFAGRHPISVTVGQHTNPFIQAMLRE